MSNSRLYKRYPRIMNLFEEGFDTAIAFQENGVGEYVSYIETFTGVILFTQDEQGFISLEMISEDRLQDIIDTYESLENEIE